jgi:riboflavin synthase
MFTGLVVARGRVTRDPRALPQGGRRLEISHPALIGSCLELGASLAVSGVCLTVVAGDEAQSSFDLAPETLARTTLGELREGDEVNLEPALRTGQALGGHWVQGHVDGVVDVLEVRDRSEDEVEVSTGWFGHRELRFSLPQWARSGVVEKGSVTLDGVSLTVSACGSDWFEVALIPHTLEVTTLGARRPGDRLNLEIDILAKYVERALAARGLGGGTA